ncbi:transmembrane protein 237B isoform X3 [Centroberyx gerrardi]
MDTGDSMKMRRRELPPLPQRGQRALPTMPSQDAAEDVPAAKSKKKRVRKEANGVDDVDDPGLEMGGLGSRRTSDFGEPLTPEPATDGPPQRRKKKKKPPAADLEDDQADLVNGDTPDQTTDGEEVVKKPKKKKKSKVAESQLPAELDVEEDDIITDALPAIPQHSLFSAPQGQSQPVGKLFVERNKRFQAAERSDWRKTSDQTDLADFQPMQPLWTTRDVSLRVHQGFRVNLARGSLALREFITLDPVALASFLYFSALVLSLSQQMTSDRINLYQTSNGTLWPPGSEHQILHPWVTVNLVVALLVGLAWIFIATRPDMDYTEGYLMAMEIEPPKPEDKSEMSA